MSADAPDAPRNARWLVDDPRYPVLEFEWRGHTVHHPCVYTKRTLFARGLVFLGAEWERRVPPVRCTIEGRVFTWRGFTRDREVHALVGRFFRALDTRTWRPGPAQ